MTAARTRGDVRVTVVLVLVVWNLAANLVVPSVVAVPVNLVAAGLLVWLARRAGTTWDQLGMRADMAGRGLRVGAVAAAIVVAAAWGTASLPGGAAWFADARLRGADGDDVLFSILVRIPLATAVAEEVAFRGVLLGTWMQTAGQRRAVVVSSVLFGLWHVLPALDAVAASSALGSGTAATSAAVAGQVLATSIAGTALAWLRFRGASVLAPVLAHWGLNAAGYAVAWAAVADGAG